MTNSRRFACPPGAVVSRAAGQAVLGFTLLTLLVASSLSAQTPLAPVLYYSDIVSGPNTGGEANKGAYVTVYGRRFGATRGASSVTVGAGTADNYPVWTDSKIVFQLGAAAGTGNIVVNVAGQSSNPLPFTVRAGNIYFVSTAGNDSANGSFATPWRTVVQAKEEMQAGDITYAMNGVSQTTQDPTIGSAYKTTLYLTTNGTAAAPIALLAYPGATVTVGSPSIQRGIRTDPDGSTGNYWVIGGLVLRASDEALETEGGFIGARFVGNDISCPNGDLATGCIVPVASGNVKILGNEVHDVGKAPSSSKLYHVVYVADGTNHVEVGWNVFRDNRSCYTVQFYSGGDSLYDISVHDNLMHHDNCAAINFATVDPSRGRVEAYNNVIHDVGNAATPPDGMGQNGCVYVPGYHNGGPEPTGNVEVFNNTCYNVGGNPQGSSRGAYYRDGGSSPNLLLNLRNNVTVLTAGQRYAASWSGVTGTNNLWFGVGNGPTSLAANINADPLFVDVAARNLRLSVGSPAINAGANTALPRDFDGNPRSAIDVGAFEFLGGGGPPLPSLSIGDRTVTEGQTGTVVAQFTVSLSTGSSDTVTVGYSTANGTAQAGTDYVAASGVVTFSPGSVQRTVDVTVNGDAVAEPNETFFVNLSAPVAATIADGQGLGTITNDDTPAPSLSINDVSVSEGQSGTRTAQFAVSLSAAASQAVTVSWATANGTALAGSDYVAGSGTLTFPAGSLQQTLNVTINGDTAVEPNETFFVNLSAPVAATIADGQGLGTITNDDTPAVPSLSINDVTLPEGQSGTATAQFVVALSAAASQAVTVSWATANGTALAGSDYVAGSGTLTFPAGSLQQTLNVTINGDTTVEPAETFLVNLASPVGATLADAQGVGTIGNDDAAPSPGDPVSWVAGGGVAIATNTLTKSAVNGWGNAGAASSKILPGGDGYVEFTALETNTYRLLGLSIGDSNWTWDDIDYALYPLGNATLQVYERGTLRGTFGPYVSGDKLRVAVAGNVVRYYRNATLLYTSTVVPAYPLLVDAALHTNGATLAGVVLSGPWVESNKDPMTWTNRVGVAASGTALTKNAVTGWGNAGAVSTRVLASGDGFVEHTVLEANTSRMLGLSNGNSSASWDDIDYCLYSNADGTLRVVERGVSRGSFGAYAAGDRLRVATVGGVVRYYRNATLLYSSAVPPAYPLVVDTSFYTAGATLSNVVVSRNWLPANNETAAWTGAGGVTASPGTLVKTAAAGWGNAGAVSAKTLPSGNGFVETTIGETTTYRMFGLSNGNSSQSWQDIDYAFYPTAGGALQIYERGVGRGTFGTYAAGDKLRVAVVGGVVRYYRNGVLLYTSPMAPVFPLLVDTALYDTGATLGEVVISRTFR